MIDRLLAPFVLACALPALAAPGSAPERILERLRASYPATQFSAVTASPIAGLFEVRMGDNIAYVSDDVRYFLFGAIYDLAKQEDVTARRRTELPSVAWSSLPLADAIRTTRGTPRRRLAVFSDPLCGHCRALEQQLAALDEIEIYTFLLPFQGAESAARSQSVWCAPDRGAAWKALMQGGTPVPSADCATPISRNLALADRLAIAGTPTLVAGDGRVLAGGKPAAEIDAWLSPRPLVTQKTPPETFR